VTFEKFRFIIDLFQRVGDYPDRKTKPRRLPTSGLHFFQLCQGSSIDVITPDAIIDEL
jgi:hypothetical protein